jgi:hypothetical protein
MMKNYRKIKILQLSYLFMYTIHEIANRLTELLREQNFVQAYEELFAEDAESIDPIYAAQPPLKGLVNLVDREKQFLSRSKIHQIIVSEPIVSGSHFAVSLSMDFTPAGQDKKQIGELCIYKVADGKIISQQFFIG